MGDVDSTCARPERAQKLLIQEPPSRFDSYLGKLKTRLAVTRSARHDRARRVP